jgi:hypothetical protein
MVAMLRPNYEYPFTECEALEIAVASLREVGIEPDEYEDIDLRDNRILLYTDGGRFDGEVLVLRLVEPGNPDHDPLFDLFFQTTQGIRVPLEDQCPVSKLSDALSDIEVDYQCAVRTF